MTTNEQIEAVYISTPLQQGIIFHTLLAPESGVYFEQTIFKLEGARDAGEFVRCCQQLADRHSVLRTAFAWESVEKIFQVVFREVSLPLDVRDWRDVPECEHLNKLNAYLDENERTGFDISQAPLARLSLLQTGPEDYFFIWSHHHALLDGWSTAILLKELLSLFNATLKNQKIQLPDARPFRDYIAWLQRQDMAEAEAYWTEVLSGFTVPTPLPPGKTAGNNEFECSRNVIQVQLDREVTDEIVNFTRSSHLTLSALTMGAWALLLGRYSFQSDVVFGTTVSGRSPELPGAQDMVGLLMNTVPARVRIDAEEEVIPWLARIQQDQALAREYDYVGLANIQGWSEVPQGTPLFESLFVFENYPIPTLDYEKGRSGFRAVQIFRKAKVNYPLSIGVFNLNGLQLMLTYDDRRFEAACMSRVVQHLSMIIQGMAKGTDRRLKDIPMITREEAQLLTTWNATEVEYPLERCIHRYFEIQVEKTPDAVALSMEGQSLSYQELNERSNCLAHYLRRQRVGPDKLVGLCMERSLEMVVGILGTLKAGGAFVPLEPDYPKERLQYLISDSAPAVVLTQASVRNRLPETEIPILRLDADSELLRSYSRDNPLLEETGLRPEHLACVIYTPGSTGDPKGVMSTHAGIVNSLLCARDAYAMSDDRVLQKTPFTFAVSLWEFLLPLLWGGQLVMARPGDRMDPDYLSEVIDQEQITTIHFSPSMLRIFLEYPVTDSSQSLRRVLCSGEALSYALQIRFAAILPKVELHNLYSIMEASVHVTSWLCQPEIHPAIVPLGRPLANMRIYILDRYMQPVPPDVTGDIYIGGVGVARGYLNQPALTEERFIEDPFSGTAGARMYKTGDLGRWLADGVVEYLGRNDAHGKTQGVRSEFGEIDAALLEHAAVEYYADARLQGKEVSSKDLHEYLKSRLPGYMLPAFLERINELTATPDGKLNRRGLPAQSPEDLELLGESGLRNAHEEIVSGIFASVLKLKEVRSGDNFFELGGHSLLATQVVSRVRKIFNVEVSLRSLFEAPTVARLAERVQELQGESQRRPPRIERVGREGNLPLSFAQQRLWFLAQLEPESRAYHVPFGVRLRGKLDVGAVERSLREIVRRHEVLRTSFPERGGVAVQEIEEPKELKLEVVEVGGEGKEQEERVREMAREEWGRLFDLGRGPLLRMKLLRVEEEEHVLLVTMHHVVSDGWSVGVMSREFTALYNAYSRGEESPLEELGVQYADFAVWQRKWLEGEVLEEQLGYWRKQLEGLETLELPTDFPRSASFRNSGAREIFETGPDLSGKLATLCQCEGVNLFMALVASFQVALGCYTGQDDIAVGTDIANRNQLETENLIGFFVNQLVLRTDLSGNPTFRQVLARVRRMILEAYEHQDLPFDKLVEDLSPARDPGDTPFFRVKLVLQNIPMPDFVLAGLNVSLLDVNDATPKFDILFNVIETSEGLQGSLDYDSGLFSAATIKGFLNFYHAVLTVVTEDNELLDASREKLVWAVEQKAYGLTKQLAPALVTSLPRQRVGQMF